MGIMWQNLTQFQNYPIFTCSFYEQHFTEKFDKLPLYERVNKHNLSMEMRHKIHDDDPKLLIAAGANPLDLAYQFKDYPQKEGTKTNF